LFANKLNDRLYTLFLNRRLDCTTFLSCALHHPPSELDRTLYGAHKESVPKRYGGLHLLNTVVHFRKVYRGVWIDARGVEQRCAGKYSFLHLRSITLYCLGADDIHTPRVIRSAKLQLIMCSLILTNLRLVHKELCKWKKRYKQKHKVAKRVKVHINKAAKDLVVHWRSKKNAAYGTLQTLFI
jgi:hypothetical protein